MVEFFQECVNLGLASKENAGFIRAKGAQTRIRCIAEQRWGDIHRHLIPAGWRGRFGDHVHASRGSCGQYGDLVW